MQRDIITPPCEMIIIKAARTDKQGGYIKEENSVTVGRNVG